MKNVEASELAKFARLAAVWWDRQGPFKALHDINPLRVGYIDGRAPLAGRSVLDVGCGGGILAEAMAARGARVTGIDAGAEALGAARHHLRESGLAVDYRKATAEEFAGAHAEGFEVVVCLELLEHVPEPASIVAACARLAGPGADLFFATLNRNLKSFVFAILGAEVLLRLVRRGTHTWRRFVTPAELKGWGEAAGLAFLDLTGLHYNPFLRKYSLGGNAHVNYLMHLRKPAPRRA